MSRPVVLSVLLWVPFCLRSKLLDGSSDGIGKYMQGEITLDVNIISVVERSIRILQF